MTEVKRTSRDNNVSGRGEERSARTWEAAT
jgi:hypothetical protein